MSCSRQFCIKMPQMSVAPSLWLNVTTELILDTSKNKTEKIRNQATTKCQMQGSTLGEKNQCQTDEKGPLPSLCVNC